MDNDLAVTVKTVHFTRIASVRAGVAQILSLSPEVSTDFSGKERGCRFKQVSISMDDALYYMSSSWDGMSQGRSQIRVGRRFSKE